MTDLTLPEDSNSRRVGFASSVKSPGEHMSVRLTKRGKTCSTPRRPISKVGLDSNELCVWAVSSPITEDDAWTALSVSVRDLPARKRA